MTDSNGSAQPVDDGRVEISVDGRSLRVPKGTLVVDAATMAGIHIPVYCAHPKMDPVAVCRMCLVGIEKMPKLQPACATYVNDGMVVHTQTDQVTKMREGMLEFLLLNHPLDCPVCDRGGECDLQDFAFRYGPDSARMRITEKVHFDKAVPLSDKIELDNERCILCWRCVRYYDEITGEKEIVLTQRGVHTAVATFDGRSLTSEFQGNLPEVCPVGALTHRQYRFKARPWDLQRTRSICPECSYGCNINVDSREYDVKRFASRDNPLVDDMWLCDRGRYSATSWNDVVRVRVPAVRDLVGAGAVREVGVAEAIAEAARQLADVGDRHGAGAVGVIASPRCTNEELWLLQRLAREVLDTPHLDHQLEAMARPSPDEHALGIAEIEECSAIVVLGEEPERNAPVLTLRLYKAARKRGVRIHRVDAAVRAAELPRLVAGERLVGLIADEGNRTHAAGVAVALAAANEDVRRLTVTRGVNGRGAKDLGMVPDLLPGYRPSPVVGMGGSAILSAAAGGDIKALLLLDGAGVLGGAGDPLRRALSKVAVVVAIESEPGPISEAATVLIPGHTYLEKQGSVTNLEGRVQRIRPALPPATAIPMETRLLARLAGALGAPDWPEDPVEVHRAMVAAVEAYRLAGNGARAHFSSEAVGAGPAAGRRR